MSRRAWSCVSIPSVAQVLKAESFDARDDGTHLIKVPIFRGAPGRAHTEPRRAGRFRDARFLNGGWNAEQLLGFHAGIVVPALRAIRAIFRVPAGLDRQQRRDLNRPRIKVQAMNPLRVEHQLYKRQIEQSTYLFVGPVAADAVGLDCLLAIVGCGMRRLPLWSRSVLRILTSGAIFTKEAAEMPVLRHEQIVHAHGPGLAADCPKIVAPQFSDARSVRGRAAP